MLKILIMPIVIKLIWRLCAILTFIFLSISNVYAGSSLIYAGFSFVGDASENQERYPYASELASQTTASKMPLLDSALRQAVTKYYHRDEKLIDTQKDINGETSLALSFGLSQESVEKVGWQNSNLYIYRVLAQIMIFDFSQKLLLANFPAMLQYQELDKENRDEEAHRKVFRQIYLNVEDKDKSIFSEWVTRLNAINIKEAYPFFLRVGSLTLDPALINQLPSGWSPKTYGSEVVQLFESILSKEQNVSLVPYVKGQAVGAKMTARFSDARTFMLKLPEADYLFDIKLHEFKHLVKKSGQCDKHAFGAFSTFNLSLPASGKQYLNQRFKKVNFATFSANDNVVVDVWHGQQTTLRSLFVNFSQQISQRNKKVLSPMVKEPKKVSKTLKHVEEVIAKCR